MDITLEAFNRIANDWPDSSLTIIGTGPMEQQLREMVVSMGLSNRVQLIGGLPHEEVIKKMCESDLFVLPSWGEGYGIVYIEAMAAGMIVVGSSGEGIEDTIQDGVNGFLIPAGDVDATEAVMRKVFEDEHAFDQLRINGIATARKLTWERNAHTMEEIYYKLRKQYEKAIL